MKVPQVRISTLILLIAIIALSMALAIQRASASRREAVLQRRLKEITKEMAVEVRDALGWKVRLKEEIVMEFHLRNRSNSEPEVRAAIAEMKKAQAELRASMVRLRSLP